MSQNNVAPSPEIQGYVRKNLPPAVRTTGIVLFVIGLLLGIAAFISDTARASFSYLVSFMFIMSVSVGALFLIALEYIANADWSVPFRRIVEFFAAAIPFLIVLALPLLFNMTKLFEWNQTEIVNQDPVLQGKSPYLNPTFFIIRVVVLYAVWYLFYFVFTRNSHRQDQTGDQSLTKTNITYSGVFMPVFAVTLTVAAVDWMMSLAPHWFSTMFGVYYFAGTTWCAFAALTLVAVLLNQRGYLHSGLNNDHYYSLGTMMLTFTVFWAYIAFSQYMLIWYADMPEESFWFAQRWHGPWAYFSVALIIMHFVVPFGALLSYPSKTNPGRLKFISVWILITHYLDLYWMIMPNYGVRYHTFSVNWMDFVFPVFSVGLLILIFSFNAAKWNLIPVRDPKLQRGLDFKLYEAYDVPPPAKEGQ